MYDVLLVVMCIVDIHDFSRRILEMKSGKRGCIKHYFTRHDVAKLVKVSPEVVSSDVYRNLVDLNSLPSVINYCLTKKPRRKRTD